MRDIAEFDILILPGWQNSGPDHWQTHWQAAFPTMRRVEQDDWEAPVYSDWARRLDEVVATCDRPVLLVAHSLGTALVSRWAHEGDRSRVAGAFLVAASDVDRFSDAPGEPVGFGPAVMKRLPFPSIVLASSDDDYVSAERAAAFASAWGARPVDMGAVGHMGSAARLGLWPPGLVWFGRFVASLEAAARS